MNKPYKNPHKVFTRVQQIALLGLVIASPQLLADELKTVYHFNKNDPYEQINRKVYRFNTTVDDYVGKPMSTFYKWVTPQFVQTGIFNFFNNLKGVNIIFNDVLQAKFEQGAQDTGRLAVNSLAGVAGFVDVASEFGWEQGDEDFEQTLAVWGVDAGPYFVFPMVGPSTARGIPGSMVDTATSPTTYANVITSFTLPVQMVSLVNTRANVDGYLKFINEAALDPYVFTRDSFLQWRNSLAKDGNVSTDIEEFEDAADSVAHPVSTLNVSGFKDASGHFGQAQADFAEAARLFAQSRRRLAH